MKKLLLLLTLIAVAGSTFANAIYVDATATGANNGSSWTHAYTSLSTALAAANGTPGIDSILVAAGNYYPTGAQSAGNRTTAFIISRSGLRIYGGYPAGGGLRNVKANATVLNGDLGTSATTDNSYHVLVIAGVASRAEIVIDGISISNGAAEADGSTRSFNGQALANGFGAGLCLLNNLAPVTLNNCIISNHSSTSPSGSNQLVAGAGIYVSQSAVTMTNCMVAGNRTTGQSGHSSPFPEGHGTPGSPSYGAGIYSTSASINMYNCIVHTNTAVGGGTPGSLGVVAAAYGGGIYSAGSQLNAINCTFTNNRSTGATSGPAWFSTDSLSDTVYNCIFWGNSGQSANSTTGIVGANIKVNNSIAIGNYNGTGNIAQDPQFVNAGTNNYRLQPTSPAINIGSNAAVPVSLTKDMDDSTRIQLGTVDAGAYESPTFQLGIIGATDACIGKKYPYAGNSTGGSFVVSNPVLAAIDSNGILTALQAGTDTLYYSIGGNTVSKIITITGPPSAGSIGGPVQVCVYDSFAITASVAGGKWYSSKTAMRINANTGRGYVYAADSAYIYYVVSNAGGCTDTARWWIKTVALPDPGSIYADQAYGCIGTTTRFYASTSGYWLSDHPALLAIDSLTGDAHTLAAGNVTVFHITSNASGCSAKASSGFTIYPPHTTGSIDSIPRVCFGTSALPHCTLPGGSWYTSTPSLVSINQETGEVQTLAAGTAHIYHVADNLGACGDTAFASFTIVPPVVPVITLNGMTLSTGTGYGYYEWYRNGTLIPNANNATYTATTEGFYQVYVVDVSGCGGMSASRQVFMTGIDEAAQASGIAIYPNPAQAMLTVRHLPAEVAYSITDLSGKTLISGIAGKEETSIDVHSLAPGLYLLVSPAGTARFSRQ